MLSDVQGGPAEVDTRDRLLDAAEGLIAEQGIDAVSIRSVNAAAGRSSASVHYHFGSKEALVAAVAHRREATIGAHRAKMLVPLEQELSPALQRVAEAMVVPLADIRRDQPWGRTYLRFLDAVTSGGPRWRAVMDTVFAGQHSRLHSVVARAIGNVPEPVRRFRLELASELTLKTLAHIDVFAVHWMRGHDDDIHIADSHGATEQALTAVIDIVTAMLGAPARSMYDGA